MIDNFKSPYFARLPRDKYVVAHQTAIIKARISAIPKPQIQWYKNMKPIFNGTLGDRIKVVETNKNFFIKTFIWDDIFQICHYEPDTYTLEIENVTLEDMALYTCIARNCNGRATASASVNIVHVQVEQYPKFSKRLESTSILTGRDGQLEVKATGKPQIKVKWYKDYKPVQQDQHLRVVVQFILQLHLFIWWLFSDSYYWARYIHSKYL